MEYLIPDNYYRDDLDNREVMVSIHCIAYNQGKYIKETLDGFIAQKTNFRFEAIVHDDASTDNTADIIREYAQKYPSIIKPIFETENQYSKGDGSLSKIMYSHIRGKYVAYCEGDDYWIDPLKLQKQVDFLEKNPDFGLVCSDHETYIQQEKYFIKKSKFGVLTIQNINQLIVRNCVTTLTVCIRKNILLDYSREFNELCQGWACGDYPIWLYTSTKYKIYRSEDIMGVYRKLSESASHSKDFKRLIKWAKSEFNILTCFIKKYNIPKEIINKSYYFRIIENGYIFALANEKEYLKIVYKYLLNNHQYIPWIILKLMTHNSHLSQFLRRAELSYYRRRPKYKFIWTPSN